MALVQIPISIVLQSAKSQTLPHSYLRSYLSLYITSHIVLLLFIHHDLTACVKQRLISTTKESGLPIDKYTTVGQVVVVNHNQNTKYLKNSNPKYVKTGEKTTITALLTVKKKQKY